jgi:two-component system, OmpR family, sensor histidine kinase SenX3
VLVLAIAAAVVALVVAFVVGLVVGRAGRTTRDPAAATPESRPAATPVTPEPVPISALVVEMLDHGVVVVDRDERAILVNPAARSMGVLDVDRIAFPELVELCRRSMDTAQTVAGSVALPMGRLGREPIALAVTAVPLPDLTHGERIGSVALLLADVSEQRRLEAVRRDFVANVSHELKTPVGALTLLAEAVQDAAGDPETVARFATRMQHEGARLGRLVRELIELSRIQGAEPMPGAVAIPVRAILAEASDRTHLTAESAGISVTVRVSDDLVVRGNVDQLVTAVSNLIDNAIAYSASGTRIGVTASAGSDDDARPCVDIAVNDQGIGIADADRERIFERFYRVDPARSRATGGTGLGLAIVKNIATNHLGSVSVWSLEGQGSTFTIRLPRVHSDARTSAASAPTITSTPEGSAIDAQPVPSMAKGTE